MTWSLVGEILGNIITFLFTGLTSSGDPFSSLSCLFTFYEEVKTFAISRLSMTAEACSLRRPSEGPVREPGSQETQLLLKGTAILSDVAEVASGASEAANMLDSKGRWLRLSM